MSVRIMWVSALASAVVLLTPAGASAQAEPGAGQGCPGCGSGPGAGQGCPGCGSGPGAGQGCPGCGSGHGTMRRGGRMGGGGGRMFDPSSVTTVQGEVVEVVRTPGRHAEGVRLQLAVGSETLDVHLGPSFYVDKQAVKVAKGDRVAVKGSRVTRAGKPALIAQELSKDGEVLALRDPSGVPVWAGAGRRARGAARAP